MNISIEEFYNRTSLDLRETILTNHLVGVVSLRDIERVRHILVMRTDYLESLLANVVLEGDREKRVYLGCEIERMRIDPTQLMVGQTFVQRSKYRAILENLPNIYRGFQINHGAKCTALIFYGVTKQGDFGVAHYIPPLIERHNDHLVLLDGVHRNFVTKGAGTTIESIVISGIKTPFPCDPVSWDCVRPVDEKPPRNERFRNFNQNLFRDLQFVGIDG